MKKIGRDIKRHSASEKDSDNSLDHMSSSFALKGIVNGSEPMKGQMPKDWFCNQAHAYATREQRL
jgi:hypothetical protein